MLIFRQLSKLQCNYNSFRTAKYLSKKIMNKVYMLHSEPSGNFEIKFSFSDKDVNVNRQFNFKRSITETVDVVLSRVKTNVEKVVTNKSKRRKKGSEEPLDVPEVTVSLTENEKVVDGSRICKEVFFSGAKELSLHILEQNYSVVINPPWVLTMVIPQSLMAGSYAYPCKFEMLFGLKSQSEFVWFKSDASGQNWHEVSSGSLLFISDELIGCKLKLVCYPGNGAVTGPEVAAISNAVVKQGPVNCPFTLRHNYTKEPLPSGSFRVVSYNILADVYAESVAARTELFPYCPPYAMNIDYRKQLIIREILGYNADIVCLQEVDARIFKNDLTQVLEDYEGVLTRKGGTVAEGVATFYAKRKFRLLEQKEISFADEVDKNPVFADIWNAIKDNEPVVTKLKERSTVFHALVLESSDKIVIVGNTHLFFHPTADHIRLIQAGMAVKFMEDLVYRVQKNGKRVSLVFCGDMNSTPDCGLYLLMTQKKAPSDLPDWHSDKSEVVKGLELTQPFEMASAYGAPEFTNYTVGFSGCLDYIYYQTDALNLLQTVPIPSEDILKEHTALPSPVFPSDHVALIADFSWITT